MCRPFLPSYPHAQNVWPFEVRPWRSGLSKVSRLRRMATGSLIACQGARAPGCGSGRCFACAAGEGCRGSPAILSWSSSAATGTAAFPADRYPEISKASPPAMLAGCRSTLPGLTEDGLGKLRCICLLYQYFAMGRRAATTARFLAPAPRSERFPTLVPGKALFVLCLIFNQIR
jgi:hypothetical protein